MESATPPSTRCIHFQTAQSYTTVRETCIKIYLIMQITLARAYNFRHAVDNEDNNALNLTYIF